MQTSLIFKSATQIWLWIWRNPTLEIPCKFPSWCILLFTFTQAILKAPSWPLNILHAEFSNCSIRHDNTLLKIDSVSVLRDFWTVVLTTCDVFSNMCKSCVGWDSSPKSENSLIQKSCRSKPYVLCGTETKIFCLSIQLKSVGQQWLLYIKKTKTGISTFVGQKTLQVWNDTRVNIV